MAARETFPGTTSPGDLLTSDDIARLPGGWLGYAERTSAQTGITSETDLTGLTETVTVPAGRRIRIRGQGLLTHSAGDGRLFFRIREGSDQLWNGARRPGGTEAEIHAVEAVVTPSSGSHTYRLTLERAGSGSASLNGSATSPAFLTIEDIGPAS